MWENKMLKVAWCSHFYYFFCELLWTNLMLLILLLTLVKLVYIPNKHHCRPLNPRIQYLLKGNYVLLEIVEEVAKEQTETEDGIAKTI